MCAGSRSSRRGCGTWSTTFASPERTAREGIRRLTAFFHGIGLPTTLKELGVTDDRFAEMAGKAVDRGEVGNFVRLDAAAVQKIFALAR